jgi:hypothetical protein
MLISHTYHSRTSPTLFGALGRIQMAIYAARKVSYPFVISDA